MVEFEKLEEAKFVKQIDKLEAVLQALFYEKIQDKKLDEFFIYTEKQIKSPELKSILIDVLKIR